MRLIEVTLDPFGLTTRRMSPMAELPPPFVAIDGLSNFRDIGGWPIEHSNGGTSTVRKGIFYRGPDTSTVTLAGLAGLKALHVTTDFDLRSKGQIEKAGGATELEGIKRVWCPAFPDGEYSPEKAAARYVQYASDGTEVRSSCSQFLLLDDFIVFSHLALLYKAQVF